MKSNSTPPNSVIQGLWQASTGHSHQEVDLSEQLNAYTSQGLNTLDFGDIYLGVEQAVGDYIEKFPGNSLRLHTKYVPDKSLLPTHSRENVFSIINRSRDRLRTDVLDLVQFHWWDYSVARYLEAMEYLFQAKDAGLIKEVGVTNFDTSKLREFIQSGLKPHSIQLQYSLLDRRPENGMIDLCQEHDIRIFCYGTVAGGFLSEKYLNQPEPLPPYENRSLIKYKLIINEIGGWTKFQELLQVLHSIGTKKGCDIATVASSYILAKKGVDSVIIGVRNTLHLDQHLNITKGNLDQADIDLIDSFLSTTRAPSGDVYSLEREDPNHSGIMHMNNNKK